ncbi:MAG: Fur family transcriptional regulator [Geitlerinemataceae cyanobacterium]
MNHEAPFFSPIRSYDEAIERCKNLGMRVSRQRMDVLELLWSTSEHLCAREIYARLERAGRHIGYTSVYQNLEALSKNGIIECLDRAEARLYGHVNAPHSHVNCLDTDEIVDVYVELPPELLARIEAQTGVTIASYRIDFFGRHRNLSPRSNPPAGQHHPARDIHHSLEVRSASVDAALGVGPQMP